MLRDREGVVAEGLSVPARDAREPVRDVLDLDVERRRIEKIETAARQHALPGARRRAGAVGHQSVPRARRLAASRRWPRREARPRPPPPPARTGSCSSSAARSRSSRTTPIACPSADEPRRPSGRSPATMSAPGSGSACLGMQRDDAPPRRAAMAHAAHHLLADVAALVEGDAVRANPCRIEGKGVAEDEVDAALGNGERDPVPMPVGGRGIGRDGAALREPAAAERGKARVGGRAPLGSCGIVAPGDEDARAPARARSPLSRGAGRA